MLSEGEVVVFHADFEQLYLLVGRTGGQVPIVWRNPHLEDVVLMHFVHFWVFAGHVLHVAVYVPLVVSERHPLKAVAHRYRPDCVVRLYCVFVLVFFVEIPFGHHAAFVPEHYRTFVGVQSRAVDGFAIFMLLDHIFGSEVENAQPTVFASRIDSLISLAEAANRSDIALEIGIKRTLRVLRFSDIDDLDAVVHTDNDFILGLCNFDAVGGRGEFDGFARVAVPGRRVPEPDGVVVGAARQFERHFRISWWIIV